MNSINRNPAKTIAKILLILLLLSIAGNITVYFQTKYQLVSPLIPRDTILLIVDPFLLTALISTIGSIAALLFYFYKKYLITITICGAALIAGQVYLLYR